MNNSLLEKPMAHPATVSADMGNICVSEVCKNSAQIGFEMECPITSRRNLAVTVLRLCAHSKTATYCERDFL